MQPYNIYWGEAHDNTYQFGTLPVSIEEVYRRATSHLDFYATAYYTSCADAFQEGGHLSESDKPHKLILEGWKDRERLDREWSEIQGMSQASYRPGEFVTFPGYEWQGNGSSGDHNVFSRSEGLPIFHVNTLAELYHCLREARASGQDAIAIPHHTGYHPGRRGRDWSVHDESLSPFAELFSIHGCSETDEEWIGLRQNSHMGPGHGGGTYQDALDRGLHLGAVCSTDNWGDLPGHYGNGLAACLAKELTRERLWEAFLARRVYGVTGDRIEVDFRVNEAPMGSIITSKGKRSIGIRVEGADALDRIEVLRNGRVIHTHCHQGTWQIPEPGRRSRFKIRIEAGWGPRPNEMDMPDRAWKGEITVENGRFLGFQPCWITAGQSLPQWENGRVAFAMTSSIKSLGERSQNADVFTFEADPGSRLALRLNGLAETGAVAEFARSSRVIWYKDEAARLLEERAGITPGSPEREDVYWHVAYKAKIHRIIPEAGYAADVVFEDDEPLTGEVNYRVRVEQRNAQRAWTSPIWVSPEV